MKEQSSYELHRVQLSALIAEAMMASTRVNF